MACPKTTCSDLAGSICGCCCDEYRCLGVVIVTPADAQVIWTDYLRYRARTRGFDLALIEQLLRFASERYFDTVTRCWGVIGRHRPWLVMVPYDQEQNFITPVTVHVTTRQQITFCLQTGRFVP